MRKKFYFIGKTFFSQSELNYSDNEQANSLLKKADIQLANLNSQTVGSIIDVLYEGGILKQLFEIVLKKEKRGWRGVWNFFRKDEKEIILKMTNSKIAEVAIDFFIFKSSWFTHLINSAQKSDSPIMKMIATMNQSHIEKSLTR
jgi:predicted DNA-binding antitoxin AbrB/MazE fold protein